MLDHDEVTFALWAREHPETKVLARVDPELDIRKGWEIRMKDVPTVVPAPPKDPLHRRELVVGIVAGGRAKAYPRSKLTPNENRGKGKPPMTAAVMDTVGGVPVAVLVGGDGISIRVYDRRVDGQPIELMARPGLPSPARFIDAASGSEFDLTGEAGIKRGRSTASGSPRSTRSRSSGSTGCCGTRIRQSTPSGSLGRLRPSRLRLRHRSRLRRRHRPRRLLEP